MAKKTLARNQDQFLVRLPDGMRERIKAKADRAGMSMNEAIVWCLDQYFPAPQTLDDRLRELITKVAILKGDDTSAAVNELIDEIDATLTDISEKSGFGSKEFSQAVYEQYSRFHEEENDNWRDKHENPFDDRLWESSGSSYENVAGQGPDPLEDPFEDPDDQGKP